MAKARNKKSSSSNRSTRKVIEKRLSKGQSIDRIKETLGIKGGVKKVQSKVEQRTKRENLSNKYASAVEQAAALRTKRQQAAARNTAVEGLYQKTPRIPQHERASAQEKALRKIGKGQSNKQIANSLGIKKGKVKDIRGTLQKTYSQEDIERKVGKGKTFTEIKEQLDIKGGLRKRLKEEGYKVNKKDAIVPIRDKRKKQKDSFGFELPDFSEIFGAYDDEYYYEDDYYSDPLDGSMPQWFQDWLDSSGYGSTAGREYQQAVVAEPEYNSWQQNTVPAPQYDQVVPPTPSAQFQDLGIRQAPAPIQVPQIGTVLPGQVTTSQSYRTRQRQASRGTSQFRN